MSGAFHAGDSGSNPLGGAKRCQRGWGGGRGFAVINLRRSEAAARKALRIYPTGHKAFTGRRSPEHDLDSN